MQIEKDMHTENVINGKVKCSKGNIMKDKMPEQKPKLTEY